MKSYRIKQVRILGVPAYVAGIYENGKLIKYSTTMGLAGARTWVLQQGVTL